MFDEGSSEEDRESSKSYSSSESNTETGIVPATKRCCPRRSTTAVDTGHHRKSGVDSKWKKEFRWLEVVDQDDRIGVMCKICKEFDKVPRNGTGTWSRVPCFTLRKDKIKKHECSSAHKASIVAETERAGGGIAQSFSGVVTCQMKAAIGCCKCIYWLCKNEIPHTTACIPIYCS